jgi:hypothetical protein
MLMFRKIKKPGMVFSIEALRKPKEGSTLLIKASKILDGVQP